MRQADLRTHNKLRVIDEALKCFYKDGIEATNVATIARNAEVTSMSIYRYFGDKENVVLETSKLFAEKLSGYMKVMAETVKHCSNGLLSVLNYTDAFFDAYENMPAALSLLMDFSLYLGRRRYLQKRRVGMASFYETLAEPFRESIERGVQDGSVRNDADPKTCAETLINTLLGLLMDVTLQKTSESVNDEALADSRKRYKDMIEHYLKA